MRTSKNAAEVPDTIDYDTQSVMGRKELIVFLSATMAFIAVAVDLMLPAFDEMREAFDLGENSGATSRIITVYMFGLALGQLFFGPLADRLGRKRTLYVGAGVYIAAAIGAAVAPSFTVLLIARFIWGVGAAGARVVAIAIIRDRFEAAAMSSAMSSVMAVFVLVPVVAPSVGAGLLVFLPWQSLFWFCVVFALAVLAWSSRLSETLDPANRRALRPATIASGYLQIAKTRVTLGYTIAALFVQAAFTAYLASSELLVANVFDLEAEFPIIFGAVAVLFGVASLVNARIVERLGMEVVLDRALAAAGVGLALLIGIELLSGAPSFWLFMPALSVLLSTFMFLIVNLNSVAMVPLGAIAGSGTAFHGAVRTAGGAVLGGIISEQVEDATTPLVVGLAVMIACAAASIVITRRFEAPS